jgi:hypothetical protein
MGKYLVRLIYLKINPLSSIFVLALHVKHLPLKKHRHIKCDVFCHLNKLL